MADTVNSAAQTIEMTVDGNDLKFVVTKSHYSKFVDELSAVSGKVAAQQTFASRCAHPDSQAEVVALCDHPGYSQAIAGKLVEGYVPDIEITVKK